VTKRELRAKALQFIAQIIEDMDMSEHTLEDELIDTAYEICEELKDEANVLLAQSDMLNTMLEEHRKSHAKRLVIPEPDENDEEDDV